MVKKIKTVKKAKAIKNPTKKQQLAMTKRQQMQSEEAVDAVIIAPKKFMTGAEVVEECKSKIIDIHIPAWDSYIKGKVPTVKEIDELRKNNIGDEAFSEALFRASLIDFTDKDFDNLKESNGLKYMEFMKAVMDNTDLFSNALRQDNLKK